MSHKCTCARMCECVCGHICADVCMINEIAPFSGFSQSHYEHTTYILTHLLDFLSCGTIFCFVCIGDVASHEASDSRVK